MFILRGLILNVGAQRDFIYSFPPNVDFRVVFGWLGSEVPFQEGMNAQRACCRGHREWSCTRDDY